MYVIAVFVPQRPLPAVAETFDHFRTAALSLAWQRLMRDAPVQPQQPQQFQHRHQAQVQALHLPVRPHEQHHFSVPPPLPPRPVTQARQRRPQPDLQVRYDRPGFEGEATSACIFERDLRIYQEIPDLPQAPARPARVRIRANARPVEPAPLPVAPPAVRRPDPRGQQRRSTRAMIDLQLQQLRERNQAARTRPRPAPEPAASASSRAALPAVAPPDTYDHLRHRPVFRAAPLPRDEPDTRRAAPATRPSATNPTYDLERARLPAHTVAANGPGQVSRMRVHFEGLNRLDSRFGAGPLNAPEPRLPGGEAPGSSTREAVRGKSARRPARP